MHLVLPLLYGVLAGMAMALPCLLFARVVLWVGSWISEDPIMTSTKREGREAATRERLAQAQRLLQDARADVALGRIPKAIAWLEELRDVLLELEDLNGACTRAALFE